jgi:hypothetical protein
MEGSPMEVEVITVCIGMRKENLKRLGIGKVGRMANSRTWKI